MVSNRTQRDVRLAALMGLELDVLVIGGGITGAGILLDAASRGIQCALIEMQDFAAGTSNRSTKLVHGGLRYLKQLEVGLVAEVGKERAIVHANAKHVTTPIWMMLPVVKGGTYGRLATSVALTVYDTLAGVKRQERHRMLSASEALAKEPLLNAEGLRGAGYYVEYRTDDARLTLENIKKAVTFGAIALNYVRAVRFVYDKQQIVGVIAEDVMTGDEFPIRAKHVVNATGPWVDKLREQDGSKTGKSLRHTKGVHIVVDYRRLPLQGAVYFDVPDGRMVFAIPRDGKTYIGTTDTDYNADLVYPRMTEDDRDYLLQAVNSMFPAQRLTPEDVESSWAGIRPLIYEDGKSPSEVSRKDEVFVSPSGLITIAGGKLTGYRKMAQKVVDLLARRIGAESQRSEPGSEGVRLNRRITPCQTKTLKLSGGDFADICGYHDYVDRMTRQGVVLGLSVGEANQLVRRYGTNVEAVFRYLQTRGHEALAFDLTPALLAEVLYTIHHEMTMCPADFFIRRTGALYFDVASVRRWRQGVIRLMAVELGWSDELRAKFEANLEDRIREATEIG